MGKFKNSDIHEKYSNWHWNLIKLDEKYKKLYVSDIDRLWLEYDFKKQEILCVIDIKYKYSKDTLTATEKGIYDWFKKHGVSVYTVYIDRNFDTFCVVTLDNKYKDMNTIEYADWLLSLRHYNCNIENKWDSL